MGYDIIPHINRKEDMPYNTIKVKNLADTIDNNDYTRRNRFTGESIELTKEEAQKHDEIFYHEALATLEDKELGTGGSKHWQEMRKRLDWFIKNNAKAYMVLLD